MKHLNPILIIGTIILVLTGTHLTLAQSGETFRVPKLNGSIELNGKADNTAWDTIEPLPLVTHWPSFGDTISRDKTELRVAYDDDYLYVSCRCYGDPDNISAPTYKRNAMNMSMDAVSIVLDTFNDNENALWFSVTPTGSRADAAISNDAQNDPNINWDTIWEAEAEVNDYGWTMEMRIPFSSLRFESNDGHVEMGLIAYRYLANDVTLQIYPAVPPKWGFFSFVKPSQTKPIVINEVENRNPVFVTPYLLGGLQRSPSIASDENSYRHESDLTHEVGLDFKMGISNNTTLDLTLNTDFAQVEADDQQINLTRFSLFFPEQRQFFLERASIFDFSFDGSDRLFHSRRIGLHEGQQVRILGGARMITRSGGWDVGLLSMQTARESGLASKNHSVARVRKQLFNPQSYAGGMLTSRIDEDGNYNLAYGIDGIFNLWGDDFLSINIAQTNDVDDNSSIFSGETTRLQAEWQRRSFSGLSYNLSYNYSGSRYVPSMGFQRRNNYMRFGDRISWGWQPEGSSPLQRIQASLNGALYLSNNDSSLESSEYGPSLELTWRRGDLATGQILYITEVIPQTFQLSSDVEVPAGRYEFPEAQIAYHTPRGRSLRAFFSVGGGSFFDGTRFTAGIMPTWDPSRIINLNLFYQLNRIEFSDRNQKLNAHIARFRTELTFNTRVTFSTFVQFNSANDLGILNLRFRYNPRDGNNFYLVFNETLNSDRDRVEPALPLSEHRAVKLKYDYTF